MRLITRNCKGVFARKHAVIASLEPDFLVFPEAGERQALACVLRQSPIEPVE